MGFEFCDLLGFWCLEFGICSPPRLSRRVTFPPFSVLTDRKQRIAILAFARTGSKRQTKVSSLQFAVTKIFIHHINYIVNFAMVREVIFWGEFFSGFYEKQDLKVKSKIDWILWLIRCTERVPQKYLKYLADTDGLYEIKISTTFKEIRILAFFDDKKLLVVTNCFYKKSQKTPKEEIELGEKLKQEYFNFKHNVQNE